MMQMQQSWERVRRSQQQHKSYLPNKRRVEVQCDTRAAHEGKVSITKKLINICT